DCLPSRLLVAGLRALRPAGALLGIVLRGGVEQRLDAVGHRLDGLGDLHPILTVPLLHEGRAMAVVVRAGELDRASETLEPEFLQAGLVEVERLEAAAHVLAR